MSGNVFKNDEISCISFGNGRKNFVIIPGLSIHGVMGLAEQIVEAYQEFAADYTVYVLDRPQVLRSEMTIRELAENVASTMQQLGISDAYLFGASQGGMIAQYLAIDHPGTVNKLILGSTLSRPNDTAAAVVGKWIELASAHDETGLLESFVDTVYSSDTLAAYRDVLIESNRGITEEEYDRFVIIASACLDFNCYDELSSITCPTFVIGSEGDRVVTADASREIADALGCEVYIYPDTYGHGVYDEAPDYLDRCIEFLNK